MRKVLWVAILLMFSGCVSDDSGTPDEENNANTGIDGQPHPDDNHNEGNQTQNSTLAPTNTPPAADLTFEISGEGPYEVAFTVNVSDVDGDVVTWTLDVNGDGEADGQGLGPGNETIELGAGTYNATVNATDGFGYTLAYANFTIEEAAVEPFESSGVAVLPCPQCREAGANTGVGYRAGESGVDSVFFDIPEQYIGKTFTATASGGDVDLAFRDACVGGGNGGGLVEDFSGEGEPTGTVPAGTVCVLMWNYDTPETTLTLTIV